LRVIGHVKFFNGRYGFIIPDGKRPKEDNVFFHETAFVNNAKGGIEDGAEVEYELIPNRRNDPKAFTVRFTGRRYAPVHELQKGAAYGSD